MSARRWVPSIIFVSFVCLLIIVPQTSLAGAATVEATSADDSVLQQETLVQVSTLAALLAGFYDGVADFETLSTYGDFGIGTFEGLDGEMIGFDGAFYQIKANGVAYPVGDSMKTPFACVTFFEADREERVVSNMDLQQLSEYLDSVLPTENIFYAVRLDGTFSAMRTRSVPAQQKPYPPLVEVTAHQSLFEFTDVKGTIVGFRCPEYVSGINVPGYHLHFLTSDGKAGGHVLTLTVEEALLSVDYTSQFLMLLPNENADFYQLDLTGDTHAETEEVEK